MLSQSTPVSEHSASDFYTHFENKVDRIGAKTMHAPAPTSKHRDVPQLGCFKEVTSDEVLAMLCTALDKQCSIES